MPPLSPPPPRGARLRAFTGGLIAMGGAIVLLLGVFASRTSAPLGVTIAVLGVALAVTGLVIERLLLAPNAEEKAFREQLVPWLRETYNAHATPKALKALSRSVEATGGPPFADGDATFQSYTIWGSVDESFHLVPSGRRVPLCLKIDDAGRQELVLLDHGFAADGRRQPVYAAPVMTLLWA